MTTPYCDNDDIDIGNVELPRFMGLDKEAVKTKYSVKAARQINAVVGQVYKLPLDLDPDSPDALYLSQINWQLASGRILLACASGREESQLNALGYYYVKTAEKALNAILDKEVILSGELVPPDPSQVDREKGPLIQNRDDRSYVDSFYGAKGTMYPDGQNGYVPGISSPW